MRTTRVEDVMTRAVVAAREETSFKELVQLMYENRVSGIPVLDDQGRLVGIVTEADLLFVEDELRERPHRNVFLEWFIHPRRLAEIEKRADGVLARDIMTPQVVTAEADTPVSEAVRTMIDAGVKRLPVVDEDQRVIGIVSRRDLLTPFMRADEEIRTEILEDVIFRAMWLDPATLDVTVDGGIATLRGEVERRSVKEILVEMVQRVDGIVEVVDELTFKSDDRKVRPGPDWGAPLSGALRSS